jgi:hypothetical protein
MPDTRRPRRGRWGPARRQAGRAGGSQRVDRQRPSSQAGRRRPACGGERGAAPQLPAGRPRGRRCPYRDAGATRPRPADPVTRTKPAGPSLAAGQGLLRPYRRHARYRVDACPGRAGPRRTSPRGRARGPRSGPVLDHFRRVGLFRDAWRGGPLQPPASPASQGLHRRRFAPLGRPGSCPAHTIRRSRLAATPQEPAPPHHTRGPQGFRPAVRHLPRQLMGDTVAG